MVDACAHDHDTQDGDETHHLPRTTCYKLLLTAAYYYFRTALKDYSLLLTDYYLLQTITYYYCHSGRRSRTSRRRTPKRRSTRWSSDAAGSTRALGRGRARARHLRLPRRAHLVALGGSTLAWLSLLLTLTLTLTLTIQVLRPLRRGRLHHLPHAEARLLRHPHQVHPEDHPGQRRGHRPQDAVSHSVSAAG